jgi:adenosylhomocysteine nucleosidase
MLKVCLYFLLVCVLSNDSLQAATIEEVFSEKGTSLVVGIISAVPGESGRLRELMESPVSYEKGMRTYYQGKLFGINTILVSARIGKVAAAATATHLILEHNVDMVIFTGVAGAIDPCLNVGDVVVGKTLMQHDMDASPFCPTHEVPLLKIQEFHSDPLLEQLAFQASKQFVNNELRKSIPRAIQDEFHLVEPKVMEGLIITGDQVISQEERKAMLRKQIPQALCVEMEGASVSQICYEYGVPCIVVRTISDYANHEKTPIDVKTFVPQVSGYYAVGIIQNMYVLINTSATSGSKLP